MLKVENRISALTDKSYNVGTIVCFSIFFILTIYSWQFIHYGIKLVFIHSVLFIPLNINL